MGRGQEGLWDVYVVRLTYSNGDIWNGVVEKANADFEANKKNCRRTKGRKGGVEARIIQVYL